MTRNAKPWRARVAEIMTEYEEDLNNMFSIGWHLQGYYSAAPIALLTEKELAEFLTEEQIKKVEEQLLARARQYVDGIRKQHDRRLGKNKGVKGFLKNLFGR